MAELTGQRRFRPGWLPTVAAALTCLLLIGLGLWQLERAEQKQALLDGFAAGTTQPVAYAALRDADPESVRYRSVRVAGRYDGDRQFLQEGMSHQGRPGLHVLTPLEVADGTVLIVNRGWVPRGVSRGDLPEAAVDGLRRELSGRIVPFPRPGMRLGEPDRARGWPRLVNYPTRSELSEALGQPVAAHQLWLAPGEADGFVREWAPAEFGPERHIGYAVQWFALALTLAIIYLVFALRGRRES